MDRNLQPSFGALYSVASWPSLKACDVPLFGVQSCVIPVKQETGNRQLATGNSQPFARCRGATLHTHECSIAPVDDCQLPVAGLLLPVVVVVPLDHADGD
jgi:hypothetical protein